MTLTQVTRTQVGVIGAGPAGLMLAHLLRLRGVESVVLESRGRAHVESRVRAGVLEHPTAELLREVGLGERMDREGLAHGGISLRFDGADHRIGFDDLVKATITVYGQQEVVKDLIAARLRDGGKIEFGVADVTPRAIATSAPSIEYTDAAGARRRLDCQVIAGCDGSHGVSREAIPARSRTSFERTYPFAWLGILAQAPPAHHELVYSGHERGFALYSMRSPSVTRLYLQVDADEDLANWPDQRIWAELRERLALDGQAPMVEGPVLEKGVTAVRSFVTEPLRHGHLFLAGDAAHIVPPTGAKGMNLAINDARLLAEALDALLNRADPRLADAYSDTALRRVWRAEHFSWLMTTMLHRFPDADRFDRRLQLAQLRYLTRSSAAAASLAENYTGIAPA